MTTEQTYTRDQISDALYQELKDSDHLGEGKETYYTTLGIIMAALNNYDKQQLQNDDDL